MALLRAACFSLQLLLLQLHAQLVHGQGGSGGSGANKGPVGLEGGFQFGNNANSSINTSTAATTVLPVLACRDWGNGHWRSRENRSCSELLAQYDTQGEAAMPVDDVHCTKDRQLGNSSHRELQCLHL